MEAHHHDYSKPLDVIWLCTPCHSKADEARREHEGLKGYAVGRSVIMMRDGETLCTFKTITDAANAAGISASGISECLSGRRKNSGGFEWTYADEDQPKTDA